MDGQMSMFPEMEAKQKKQRKAADREKRNWENSFQYWSDRHGMDANNATSYGCCGYGSMCDNCSDNSYGRPCVRALNDLCRKKGIEIEYTNRTEEYFENVWHGYFERKGDVKDNA